MKNLQNGLVKENRDSLQAGRFVCQFRNKENIEPENNYVDPKAIQNLENDITHPDSSSKAEGEMASDLEQIKWMNMMKAHPENFSLSDYPSDPLGESWAMAIAKKQPWKVFKANLSDKIWFKNVREEAMKKENWDSAPPKKVLANFAVLRNMPWAQDLDSLIFEFMEKFVFESNQGYNLYQIFGIPTYDNLKNSKGFEKFIDYLSEQKDINPLGLFDAVGKWGDLSWAPRIVSKLAQKDIHKMLNPYSFKEYKHFPWAEDLLLYGKDNHGIVDIFRLSNQIKNAPYAKNVLNMENQKDNILNEMEDDYLDILYYSHLYEGLPWAQDIKEVASQQKNIKEKSEYLKDISDFLFKIGSELSNPDSNDPRYDGDPLLKDVKSAPRVLAYFIPDQQYDVLMSLFREVADDENKYVSPESTYFSTIGVLSRNEGKSDEYLFFAADASMAEIYPERNRAQLKEYAKLLNVMKEDPKNIFFRYDEFKEKPWAEKLLKKTVLTMPKRSLFLKYANQFKNESWMKEGILERKDFDPIWDIDLYKDCDLFGYIVLQSSLKDRTVAFTLLPKYVNESWAPEVLKAMIDSLPPLSVRSFSNTMYRRLFESLSIYHDRDWAQDVILHSLDKPGVAAIAIKHDIYSFYKNEEWADAVLEKAAEKTDNYKYFVSSDAPDEFVDKVLDIGYEKGSLKYQINKVLAQKNISITDLWTRVTGDNWDKATRMGYTNGTEKNNLLLAYKLLYRPSLYI